MSTPAQAASSGFPGREDSPRTLGTVFRTCFAAAACLTFAGTVDAGVISSGTLAGGARWDAAPRTVPFIGERSLDGDLRFALQGGSYAAYRDLFNWTVTPTVQQFQTAVEQAFNAWSAVDPVSGFGTAVRFRHDSATAVAGISTGGGNLDVRGAEIDLFGSNDTFLWDPGNTLAQGQTSVGEITTTMGGPLEVKLTSCFSSSCARYAGSRAIVGADIIMNTGATYSLDLFRRILTHEIGNAIGLHDVDNPLPVRFIDDNYNAADPVGTLTNSWAHLVNPLNPAASPLQIYVNPAVGGVGLLMRSNGVGISAGNPVTNLVPLTNDEFGTRQFLYPSLAPVPEPQTWLMLGVGLAVVCVRARARRQAA